MIYHSECLTRQCARIWSDNPQLSQVIWDQTTSDLPVYNLQLPQKKDGHLGRDGHRVRHWQHGRNCRHGHDHQGSHGRHFTFIMVVMVSMVFMVNIVFRKSLQERQDRQDNQNTRNTQIWHLTWPSRQLVKGNFRNSCDVLVSRNWYWESLCTTWTFCFGKNKILRYVFSGWFGKICFCNERTPKDVLPRGAQLKMRLSRISWLIQVSERRRAKKPGYDFSLQKEIVCTFWKNIFFLIFCQPWRP